MYLSYVDILSGFVVTVKHGSRSTSECPKRDCFSCSGKRYSLVRLLLLRYYYFFNFILYFIFHFFELGSFLD